MGVYIKGMEMPTSCGDCRFCNSQADTDYGVCAWCDVDGKARDAYTRQDCPLVCVPPHGRLIDADEFCTEHRSLKMLRKVGLRRFNWHIAAAFVDDAPTIIPAEEGE